MLASAPLHIYSLCWAHSCCSVKKLQHALTDPEVNAIEADILFSADENGPIMAHPPAKTSDLDFELFLGRCLAHGSSGARLLKLDFKDMASVEPCLRLLAIKWSKLTRNGQEVWLNADVIPGPNSRSGVVPVPAHRFVPLCRALCPEARLSLGWRVAAIGAEESYSTEDAEAMEQLVHEHSIDGADLVFAAAIRVAEMAPEPLISLMQRVPGSELLLWTGTREPPVHERSVETLRRHLEDAGLAQRVGFDVQLAQSYLQQAISRLVDFSFFCSRWSRYACCASHSCKAAAGEALNGTSAEGERQPLVWGESPGAPRGGTHSEKRGGKWHESPLPGACQRV